jgi:extracellular elastinolytic metalloproteinase
VSPGARARRRRIAPLVALLCLVPLLAGSIPAQGVVDPNGFRFQGEGLGLQKDLDLRVGSVAPTARQRQLVSAMGASVVWNRFGTPHSLSPVAGGYLATGLAVDEVTAARAWIQANRTLLKLSADGARELTIIRNAPIGSGRAITFQQTFGALEAGLDGRVTLGLVNGKLAYVSSSIAPHAAISGRATVTAQRAMQLAGSRSGRSFPLGAISGFRREGDSAEMEISGFTGPQTASLVAVPTPRQGVRPAWLTQLIDTKQPLGLATYIDALTGATLVRQSLVDYAIDNPAWDVFPASPPLDYSSTDTRETWCWVAGPGCDRVVGNPSSPNPWDVLPPNQGVTDTSIGNNAETFENWNTDNPFMVGHDPATESPTRDYLYPWTNQWFEERCDPSVFESPARNDIDAAIANLFAGHNSMHDFAYQLGFREATFNLQNFNYGLGGKDHDPEVGSAQAGGIVGGPPTFTARDNANQITPKDGLPPNTNMYLWQPIAGAFYSPCVDGDFDMSVIGHEYTHAITNRMIGGPNAGISGFQGGAMGESWSDLVAMEYLNSNGFVPVGGENPFAVGPYVTGDPVAGIRNYGMNDSPLNYSDVGYDVTGPQVHADGEIWSATNFDLRTAIGNEVWRQVMFDAYLLMPSAVSMVDARDAYLAADTMRFGGAHLDEMWEVFARRGFGIGASSNTNLDTDPIPSFQNPRGPETTLTFDPVDEDGDPVVGAQLFVGHYQARALPVADTVAGGTLGDSVDIVGGTYDFLVRANGFGHTRVEDVVVSGAATQTLTVTLRRNLASAANGATVAGAGVRLGALIDDTEATNWESAGSPVADKAVIVDLEGTGPHALSEVQVSAMLFQGQNRFTALRRFAIQTCTASESTTCSVSSDFTTALTSPADAFPAVAPRPRAPQLIIRGFDLAGTATHVRFVVLHNQCTGTPGYQGDQDDDPINITDCSAGSVQDLTVRVAEVQVFGE